MDLTFEEWLRRRGYDRATISTQLSRVRRIERHYGDLDERFGIDRLISIAQVFHYTKDDERLGMPNPTLLPITGVLRTNLASYKETINLYRNFCSLDQAREICRSAIRSSRPSGPSAVCQVENPRTLVDFAFDGLAPLRAIIESSQYATMAQAVASLAVFTHPDTVRQTGGQAIFFAIRDPKRVGEIAEIGGRRIALDDNKSPTDAFLWANKMTRRGRDTQFNHIYASSGDVDSYTALPNICMTPAFMAKLTDTHQDIRKLLRFRSFDLYGWHPATEQAPPRPDDYDSLEWAPPLAPVPDVERAIEDAMARNSKNRTVKAAKELGWLFGGKQPPS